MAGKWAGIGATKWDVRGDGSEYIRRLRMRTVGIS